MNGPMSHLADLFFSSRQESEKVLSKMRVSDSYFGQQVVIGGKTYVISSGDTSDIDSAIASIEREINEYCTK